MIGIALRAALGAGPGARMRPGVAQTAAGLVLGLPLALALAAAPAPAQTAPPQGAPPEAVPSQLSRSVAIRLHQLFIDVAPEELSASQASALHLLLSQRREDGYLRTRQRALTILRDRD